MADKKKFSKKTMYLSPKDIRKRKSRIVMDSELKDMNERIKKKEETGGKDIFDYIGDILKAPYIIRGGRAKGGLIKGKPKLAKRGF
jgi:hypothetical protein